MRGRARANLPVRRDSSVCDQHGSPHESDNSTANQYATTGAAAVWVREVHAITSADAGGSNGYRSRAWKYGRQKFADETRLCVHVSHFPPGTSRWNKIEHRLLCHNTHNWRVKPLRTLETIVDLIGKTRTAAGLRVKAKLDNRNYPTGEVTTNAQINALSLHCDEFHGDWNYVLRPR